MELDSRNRFKVKYCPCNKSNRDGKFVPYKDNTQYGFCHSCEKTFRPEGFNIDFVKPKRRKEPPKEYFDKKYLRVMLFDYTVGSNNFVSFLHNSLGHNVAKEILTKYKLGTGKNNSVIFPHIDTSNNIVALKYMYYNKITGKRFNTIWFDDTVKHRHPVCLFGLHLINDDNKPIGIVESEKTACLMNYFHPYYTWLACGGSKGLKDDKIKPLNYRVVHLFPDHSKYDDWLKRKQELEQTFPYISFEVSRECEIWFEQGQIKKGEDIADYYLRL